MIKYYVSEKTLCLSYKRYSDVDLCNELDLVHCSLGFLVSRGMDSALFELFDLMESCLVNEIIARFRGHLAPCLATK